MTHGTFRKLRLSPIQREILWMLQEAWEEELPTVLNTLRVQFPHLPSEQLLAQVDEALQNLHQMDLIALAHEHQRYQQQWSVEPLTDHTVPIRSIMSWDPVKEYWTIGDNQMILVLLTEKGEAALRS